jgi:hypothetical protein
MCISGITFAFFYDFSSTSWNCYDVVVPFCCSYHYLSIMETYNCINYIFYH